MSQGQANTATILFESAPRIDFITLAARLKDALDLRDLRFDTVSIARDTHVVLSGESMSVQIARGNKPVARDALVNAKRPSIAHEPHARLSQRLHDYRHSLRVKISAPRRGPGGQKTQIGALYHILRQLLHDAAGDLILWHKTNMLFTRAEFENPRPAARQLPTIPAPCRPIRTRAQGPRHTRPRWLPNGTLVHAGGKAVTPKSNRPEPSEDTLRKARETLFAKDLIIVGNDMPDANFKPADPMEQLVVYTMSLTLMVLLFPVGFGVLLYNVLFGESLTFTARAMALTGTGLGLNMMWALPALHSLI